VNLSGRKWPVTSLIVLRRLVDHFRQLRLFGLRFATPWDQDVAVSLECSVMTKPDRHDPREMARRAIEWFRSADGQESIKESDNRVEETAALLAKGREIDPGKLHEPFTK